MKTKVFPKAKFEALVASYGATIDKSDCFDCIDAPAGKIWKCNDGHSIVMNHSNIGGQSWVNEARVDAVERMAYGLEDCDEEHCEYCCQCDDCKKGRATWEAE